MRYDLAAALEVARLVDSAGGSVAADLLAPALGYSGTNNGAYLARVANARLFGVVTGRGSRFELTERGRRILAATEPAAATARREAFLAVPLFRAVSDRVGQHPGPLPVDLAGWLVSQFGETPGKAGTVADRLLSSAAQAGLLRTGDTEKFLFTAMLTDFTPVDKPPSHRPRAPLRLSRGARSLQGEAAVMADSRLWLDEEQPGSPGRVPAWRRAGALAAAAVVLVAVAVPVALVTIGSPSTPVASRHVASRPVLGTGPAEHQVLSALSATTDSGSFDFHYTISSTPASGTAPSTTSTTVCNEVTVPVAADGASGHGGAPVAPMIGSSGGGAAVEPNSSPAPSSSVVVSPADGTVTSGSSQTTAALPPGFTWRTQKVCNGPVAQPNPVVQGSGVIDTSPLGMVASADVGGGLDVTVRLDGTQVWEEGTRDTDLAPQGSDSTGSGTDLPGFAGLTEGTLGSSEGAVAMMGMASPTGYLDLVQPAIGAAAQTGTGTVDGTAVTEYQVADDLDQLAGAPGTSSAESQTIAAALASLKAEGYTANRVTVSVDGAGFIRQVTSIDSFTDGASVTLEATFSDFGCAGTVLMPGQTGSGTPPAGCTSPDDPNASSATTTTGPGSPATVAPAPSTTVVSTPPATVGSSPPTSAPTITPPPGPVSVPPATKVSAPPDRP